MAWGGVITITLALTFIWYTLRVFDTVVGRKIARYYLEDST